MKKAKLYDKRGWWSYYRTEDGHTFSVRDEKHYFYHGNVFKDEKTTVFIEPENHKRLFGRIEFVGSK
jgi:hypothetical protein